MCTSEKPDWDEYFHCKCTFSYEIFQMYKIARVLCLFNQEILHVHEIAHVPTQEIAHVPHEGI